MKVTRALAYANMGWKVFPLTPNSKIPLPGSSGFKDATTDKATIESWWDRTPDANIGIATGTVSGIVVLDVDVKNGSPGLDSLKRINGLHPTLIAKTPSGGWHYVYGYDKKCESRGGFMPGLDFKADGGYIVGAGSDIDGVYYEWVDPEYPLAPLPDVLKTLIVKHKEDAPRWKVLEEGKPIALLQRNMTLASIAGLYRWSGMAKPEIYAAIEIINRKRCDPPLPDKDIETIVGSITRYAPSEFRQSLEEIKENDDERFVHYEEYLDIKADENMAFRHRLNGCPALDRYIDGVAPGELVVITGPKGGGKTLFSRTLGYEFLKSGCNVAWFSFENRPYDIAKAFVDKERGLGLFFPLHLRSGRPDWILSKITEAKDVFNCDVVFIDHLHYIIDMNTSQNVSLNIGATLRHFVDFGRERGVTVVLVVHMEKNRPGEEPDIDRARDSSFIGQEPATALTVYRKPDSTCDKKRNPMEWTYREGLAIVKIDKARRAGTFRERLAYVKEGEWLVEKNDGKEFDFAPGPV